MTQPTSPSKVLSLSKIEEVVSDVQKIFQGYLKILGMDDPGARVGDGKYGHPFVYKRGDGGFYHPPMSITMEVNRLVGGEPPGDDSLVDEINKANTLGKDYIPNQEIADRLRARR
ncbi:MAG: hypothetical protein IH934_05420 [Nanoarchaeota archaeon]|nr:hypothetical protein [Nanoarchaeota archaeon]